MTLPRTIGVLVSLTALLLVVVILRGETARVHYDMSELDRNADVLRLQMRENELEIVRLRDPDRVAERAAAARIGEVEAAPPDSSTPPAPARHTPRRKAKKP